MTAPDAGDLERAVENLEKQVARAHAEERKLVEGGDPPGLFALVVLGTTSAETILAALRSHEQAVASAVAAENRDCERVCMMVVAPDGTRGAISYYAATSDCAATIRARRKKGGDDAATGE